VRKGDERRELVGKGEAKFDTVWRWEKDEVK